MSNQERVEFYKEQIDLENSIVEKAKTSVKGVQNDLIRELILGIAWDSKKHAGMLNALVNMFSKPTPSIAEEISNELKNYVEEHIQLEKKAIETYRKQLESVRGSEGLILKEIIKDEIRHHKLLQTVQKMIVEKFAISEQLLWDMIEESYLDFGE
jgi:rubrerythrin